MAKRQGSGKLHPLPFTTFGEIAALGLEAEAYLRDVLARIADHPVSRVDELLPWCWNTPTAIAA
jgi:transposase